MNPAQGGPPSGIPRKPSRQEYERISSFLACLAETDADRLEVDRLRQTAKEVRAYKCVYLGIHVYIHIRPRDCI